MKAVSILIFRKIRLWWYGRKGHPVPYETQFVESEPPISMFPNVLYVVVEDELPWYASLVCPCGCGKDFHMNLLTDERPCWSIAHHWSGLSSLRPSIRRINSEVCQAHFWFVKGRIHWCHD